MFGFSKLDVMFGRRTTDEVWIPSRRGSTRVLRAAVAIDEHGGVTVEAKSRKRRGALVIVGVVLLLAGVTAGAFLLFRSANSAPSFTSLADSPDRSLHGTVPTSTGSTGRAFM